MQFFKVPEGAADEAAVMTEPFSVGLHPAARNLPSNSNSVIVIGAGTIGLMVIAEIRALGSKCRIISLALQLLKKNPGMFDGLLTHKYVIDGYRHAFDLVRNRGKNRVIKAAFDFS